MPQLSVIIPVYNEAKTIRQILEKINSLDIDKEIIVINDGSSDGTDKILRDIQYHNLKVIHHANNRGKGAAFLTGLSYARGDFVIIQDADLEYDPDDYLKLLNIAQEGKAEIVLGARFSEGHQGLFMHRLGNRFLSKLMNILFNNRINDYATCYKLAKRQILNDLNLRAIGFDIDVEIICSAFKKKKRIAEIPISYYPRTYKEGKKIRWKDGLWAIFYMFKYRFIK